MDAVSALTGLHEQLHEYETVVADARRRLLGAGFDGERRFDGSPRPSAVDDDEIRVHGTAWPALDPFVGVGAVIARAVVGMGPDGRAFAALLRDRLGAQTSVIDLLLTRLGESRTTS